jgi:CHAD domain-containing protein
MTTRSEVSRASESVGVSDLRPGDTPGWGSAHQPTITSPAGDALLAHLREQVHQVHAYDQPVRADAPDSVHKMRVAIRRLRSALTTFGPLVPTGVAKALGKELKWLAGVLGAARDAEVIRDRVRAALDAEGGSAAADPAAAVVDAELGEAYRTAHDRVLAELDDERYRALLSALDGLVTTPALTKRAAAPSGSTFPPLVARSYSQLRRIVQAADEKPAGDQREELLHDARKTAKRARYAAESVSQVFGADAIAFAKAMESVQEALGEYQDSAFTRERLRHLARQTSSLDAAFLYGRLHALEELGAGRSERSFDAAWKAAAGTSVHRWLR